MNKPTIILATSNGVGMGHLARASAVALALKEIANPIIVSMASAVSEIPEYLEIPCEYIPGKDRMWMTQANWDVYLQNRLVALAQETNAKVLSFDGVVPYPGIISTKKLKRDLNVVWIRRGLWQKNLLRFILPVKSRLMSVIIEPGDFARPYDFGPTSGRNDATLTAPVSLFSREDSLSRTDARLLLGIDKDRPAVLVQLGTGDNDVNEKMRAALSGLLGWKDLQVVLTKSPVDKDGSSLVPTGLDIKVIRFFPLAKVLRAFDASICAAGYNGVHELLPAQVPTVFVSNIRGTDDQEARAKWCNDFGYALRADQSDLGDITQKVKQLQNPDTREKLSKNCSKLPITKGAKEIAEMLYKIAMSQEQETSSTKIFVDNFINQALRKLTLTYRFLRPHAKIMPMNQLPAVFSEEIDSKNLQQLIKSSTRFEHLILGGSEKYRKRREEIARDAYGKQIEFDTIK